MSASLSERVLDLFEDSCISHSHVHVGLIQDVCLCGGNPVAANGPAKWEQDLGGPHSRYAVGDLYVSICPQCGIEVISYDEY